MLPPKDQRAYNWPKMCQASWTDRFRIWRTLKEPKTLSVDTINAIAHTLECNLAYIDELETALYGNAARTDDGHTLPKRNTEDSP